MTVFVFWHFYRCSCRTCPDFSLHFISPHFTRRPLSHGNTKNVCNTFVLTFATLSPKNICMTRCNCIITLMTFSPLPRQQDFTGTAYWWVPWCRFAVPATVITSVKDIAGAVDNRQRKTTKRAGAITVRVSVFLKLYRWNMRGSGVKGL